MEKREHWFRTWLARKLSPELARKEYRLDRIISGLRYEKRWLNPEFPDAYDTMQRVLENDADESRPLGSPDIGKLPWNIEDFREYLRRRKAGATQHVR